PFAGLALLALALNVVLLPRADPGSRRDPARDTCAAWGHGLGWLATYSVIYGAIGATFFTFAIAVAHATHHGHRASVLLWAIVGATGLAAVGTGEAIDRLGLRNIICLLLLGTAAGLLCIGLIPTSLAALDLGAALFGPAYMAGA